MGLSFSLFEKVGEYQDRVFDAVPDPIFERKCGQKPCTEDNIQNSETKPNLIFPMQLP
jgi:hypothetical protein